MDLIRIGQFITTLRKDAGLTQEQLGQRLGVTNKTVSRWETGTYLPPAEALLAMSGLFSVSVNELLSGQRLSDGEYRAAAEQNLSDAVRSSSFTRKERQDFFRKKWLREHRLLLCLLWACAAAVLLAGLLLQRPLLATLAPLLSALVYGWQNNAMMAYVEHHLYD